MMVLSKPTQSLLKVCSPNLGMQRVRSFDRIVIFKKLIRMSPFLKLCYRHHCLMSTLIFHLGGAMLSFKVMGPLDHSKSAWSWLYLHRYLSLRMAQPIGLNGLSGPQAAMPSQPDHSMLHGTHPSMSLFGRMLKEVMSLGHRASSWELIVVEDKCTPTGYRVTYLR